MIDVEEKPRGFNCPMNGRPCGDGRCTRTKTHTNCARQLDERNREKELAAQSSLQRLPRNRTITIKGLSFSYPERYRVIDGSWERRAKDGIWSTVSAHEMRLLVNVINKRRREELRQLFLKKLERAGITDLTKLPPARLAALRAQFAKEEASFR